MQKLNHPNKLSMKSFISKFPFNSATTQLVGNDQSPKQKLINNLYNGVKHDKSGKITHDGKTILFTNFCKVAQKLTASELIHLFQADLTSKEGCVIVRFVNDMATPTNTLFGGSGGKTNGLKKILFLKYLLETFCNKGELPESKNARKDFTGWLTKNYSGTDQKSLDLIAKYGSENYAKDTINSCSIPYHRQSFSFDIRDSEEGQKNLHQCSFDLLENNDGRRDIQGLEGNYGNQRSESIQLQIEHSLGLRSSPLAETFKQKWKHDQDPFKTTAYKPSYHQSGGQIKGQINQRQKESMKPSLNQFKGNVDDIYEDIDESNYGSFRENGFDKNKQQFKDSYNNQSNKQEDIFQFPNSLNSQHPFIKGGIGEQDDVQIESSYISKSNYGLFNSKFKDVGMEKLEDHYNHNQYPVGSYSSVSSEVSDAKSKPNPIAVKYHILKLDEEVTQLQNKLSDLIQKNKSQDAPLYEKHLNNYRTFKNAVIECKELLGQANKNDLNDFYATVKTSYNVYNESLEC